MMYLKTREDFARIIKNNHYKKCVEIGVRQGYFSKYILENTDIEQLYSIDIWEIYRPENGYINGDGSSLWDKNEAIKNLKCFGDKSIIFQEFSDIASKKFEDKSVDFIYIDAEHTYNAVYNDIRCWYPKVRDGGILAGHDYNKLAWPGIVKAITEFVIEKSLNLNVTGVGSSYGNDGGDCNQPSWWFYV